MPSNSYTNHLQQLLIDVDELITAHRRLTTGHRGRQWGVGSLNRAILVIAVSSWEAYIEQVIEETIILIKPPYPPVTNWQSLYASTKSTIGRFNNPNAEHVKTIFRDCIGITDITSEWYWRNCDTARAVEYLNELLSKRHEIAHGINPRPIIDNDYASWLPDFVRNLARCTDRGIKKFLEQNLGMNNIF
jgi:hypothetical protein